jgi:hypothetical protein
MGELPVGAASEKMAGTGGGWIMIFWRKIEIANAKDWYGKLT